MTSSFLGRQGSAIIPATVTSNVSAWTPPTAPEILSEIRKAIHEMERDARERPSVIAVDDDFPNGLTVTDGRLCFVTLSRDGLERVKAETVLVAWSPPGTPPSLHGLPILDMATLEASENPNVRALASYYRAAVRGYVRGLATS